MPFYFFKSRMLIDSVAEETQIQTSQDFSTKLQPWDLTLTPEHLATLSLIGLYNCWLLLLDKTCGLLLSVRVVCACVCVYKSLQSFCSLCDPVDCNPPGPSVLWGFPGKSTGVGCHALLIFPTQGLNPRLLTSPALAGGLLPIPGAFPLLLPNFVLLFSFSGATVTSVC